MDFFFYFDSGVLILAILANLFALVGVVTGNFHQRNYRRFLISLLVGNIFISAVNSVLFGMQIVGSYSNYEIIDMSSCVVEIGRRLGLLGFIVNVLNLCAMSIDHFIAIVFPHKYRYALDGPLAQAMVFLIWLSAFIIGFADYPIQLWTSADGRIASIDCGTLNTIIVSNETYHNVTPIKISLTTSRTSRFGSGANSNAADKSKAVYELTVDDLQTILKMAAGWSSDAKSGEINALYNHPCDDGSLFALGEISSSIYDLMEGASASGKESFCKRFDDNYNFYLECGVLSLTLIALIFLAICCGTVFKEAAMKAADHSKLHLRKLVTTTILLLATFLVCWMPYVSYEVSNVLLFKTDPGAVLSSKADRIIHGTLYSLFMLSPLSLSIIYAARNRVVQKHILEMYQRAVPARFRQLPAITAQSS